MKNVDRFILLVFALGMWFMGVVLMMPEKTEADVTPVMPDVGAWPFARRIIQDQNTNSYSKGEIDGITNGLNAMVVSNFTANGTLAVTGASTLSGALTVTGSSAFNGGASVAGLTVTAGITLATGSLIASNAVTVAGVLTVNGATISGDQATVVDAMADVQADQFSLYTNSGAIVIGLFRVIDGTNLVFINTGLAPDITNSIIADISN